VCRKSMVSLIRAQGAESPPVGSYREYYMGEGDGFPQVQAMVSQVSPRSPVVSPNTKKVQNEF
jgi:hypothetical protein